MFNLDNALVRIANVNPRAEKHGDENKLACDLKIEVKAPNSVLDAFHKDLRKALYRKPASGEQQDLIEGAEGLTAVKFPRVGELRWDEDFPGYDIKIGAPGLGLIEPLELVDVTVKKLAFEPLEGGSVAITFNVICHPDSDEIGQLCQLIQEEAEVTLTPPKNQ